MKKKEIISVIFLLISVITYAEIKLPAIFGENMLLQQQAEVAVWGWASPKSTVSVKGSWNNKTFKTQSNENGEWKLKISTPKAGFIPYTLTISDGKALVLKNVLIGEVWICSGQSNMEMPMKGYKNQPIENGAEDILNSENRNIRFFTVKRQAQTTPQDNTEGAWLEANAETTANFSATAYYFGRKLFNSLNVPVGLISTNKGGSRIETWMTPESLKDFPDTKIPAKDDVLSTNNMPTGLYNAMIHPIVGYGIRGAIWYQGEANASNPSEYEKLFASMVTEWRRIWEMGDFPFYFVQIAPYNYENLNSAFQREAQQHCQAVKNTGMAVVLDADSPCCIHPPKKRDAGERLALWALAKNYGKKIEYKSPEPVKIDFLDYLTIITFDIDNNTGLTSWGKEIKGFEVAGENRKFYPAKNEIEGNKIFVMSPQVPKPIVVRYAFKNTSQAELFSVSSNLPVSSFRTDDW
ncbi:MAG: sialate O-acetylesterase [Dysgonamonadaceae bacterium]|jgi:sialate O-acetylesterase|nr:sialate O-acetylesterase [Dysgonamonadaceae bacterium]